MQNVTKKSYPQGLDKRMVFTNLSKNLSPRYLCDYSDCSFCYIGFQSDILLPNSLSYLQTSICPQSAYFHYLFLPWVIASVKWDITTNISPKASTKLLVILVIIKFYTQIDVFKGNITFVTCKYLLHQGF